MECQSLGANKTELTVGDYKILVSYQTPVACINLRTGEAFRTDYRWSKTTSKHVTQWLVGRKATEQPQAYFDNLLKANN